MFQTIKNHLTDNKGDENISKMIWVAIVFVVGAIMLLLITTAFKGPIKTWYEGVIDDWFNSDNGAYIDSANPDVPGAGA